MADCCKGERFSEQKSISDGHFELEAPRAQPCETAIAFQSARVAIASVLSQPGMKRVWLPTFPCHKFGNELQRVGIEVARYELQSNLTPESGLTVYKDEAVLTVNYFGVRGTQVELALNKLPPERCVVDNPRASGEPTSDCLGIVSFCRNFFGVPDSCLLKTGRDIAEPPDGEEHSVPRCEHLLRRLDREEPEPSLPV